MKPIEKSQIEQALNRNRPEGDTERDENRMPAELLHFIEISEGQKVGEMNSGRGYLSAIIAYALEDNGMVYSHTAPQSIERWKGNPIEKRLESFPQENLIPVVGEMENPNFPDDMDIIINCMTYHDTVWTKADRMKMNENIFASLKTGGSYCIIDHHSKDGHGIDDCHSIHRIEKAFVIEEVSRAGFYFDDDSDLFENPNDPLDQMVFEKDIRDRTSRFILIFKKEV